MMKKIVTIALVLCFGLFAGNAYGQQVQVKEKAKAQKEVKIQKGDVEKVMERNKAAEKGMEKEMEKAGENKDPQGNAYGQKKGGLEGKEFGNARAPDAKAARHARAKRAKAHRRAMVKMHR